MNIYGAVTQTLAVSQLTRFSHISGNKSIERSMKIFLTKKIITLYKYVVYFHIEICFLETKIDSMAWFLYSSSFNIISHIFTPFIGLKNGDFLLYVSRI